MTKPHIGLISETELCYRGHLEALDSWLLLQRLGKHSSQRREPENLKPQQSFLFMVTSLIVSAKTHLQLCAQGKLGTRERFSKSWDSLKKSSKCPTSELTMKAGFYFSLLLSMLAQLSQAQYHYQTLMNYLESRMTAMEVRTYLPDPTIRTSKSNTKSKRSYLPSAVMPFVLQQG